MPPLVSVLLPARNASGTLPATLESLVCQTLRSWECIVVDDASHDDTGKIAEAWARRDARFRVVHRRERGGIVAALNEAAQQAQGTHLARQDADDLSSPSRLEKSLAVLEKDERIGAAACRVRLFPEEDIRAGLRAYGEWLNAFVTPEQIAREIWVESPLPHGAVVMRREAFFGCGGYRDMPWPEDYDLWLQMHGAGWQFAKSPEILYAWRHHVHRMTFCDHRYSPEAFLACKLHHVGPRLRNRALLIWGAGRDGRRLGRALSDCGHRLRAFIDIDPQKIGRRRQGLPVLPPEAIAGRQVTGLRLDRAPFLLAAVGTKGARELIRKRLVAMGWREQEDFLCFH